MNEIEWPMLLCPHCGNRGEFRIEVSATQYIDSCRIGNEPPEILELPFNSRVWCLACGKVGRSNAWQRGAYVEGEKSVFIPDDPEASRSLGRGATDGAKFLSTSELWDGDERTTHHATTGPIFLKVDRGFSVVMSDSGEERTFTPSSKRIYISDGKWFRIRVVDTK